MRRLKIVLLSSIAAAAGIAVVQTASRPLAQSPASTAAAASTEWPTYGHDAGHRRFSPLTEITTGNVGRLEVAWTYHMRPPAAAASASAATTPGPQGGRAAAGGGPAASAGPGPAPQAAQGGGRAGGGRGRGGAGFSASQVTPIVVNGVMYIATPYGRVVAVDPTTGTELWAYQLPSGQPSTRGVEYWPGDTQTPPQIVFGTNNGKLHSVDAKTGKPNPAFGVNGVVELNTPEIMQGASGNNALTSPPAVYRNLVITGGRTQEVPATGISGDVRAWDIHTGKLVWTFRTVPRPGEPFSDTWAGESWRNRSGVNVWGFISVDHERGILYLPLGAPSVDQYGGDRAGDNLFGTSLVAVEAATGKYLWHFQLIHHDIWDGDVSSAPALIDIRRNGKTIPSVAVIGKSGLLYLLDRVTGQPIYGVEERPVPASEVPLERAAKTQPFPVKPAPLSRMTMSAAEVATVTPEIEAACRKLMDGMQLGGPFLPQAYNRLRVQFPGNHGGVNWGGTAFNPALGLMFVYTSEMGQVAGLRDRAQGATGPAQPEGQGNRVDPTGPYEGVPGGGRFSVRLNANDPQQLLCQQPPWGQMTAVDVNTGEFAWRVPVGITESLPTDKQNTGRPGNGGPIATAGGLVFLGATDDSRFRALDARTGKELWTYKLEGAAQAVPMTYRGRDGRQYVVIAGTGGGFFGNAVSSDSLVAFALPR
jgi:quinoprotein glucose dehydrogenase